MSFKEPEHKLKLRMLQEKREIDRGQKEECIQSILRRTALSPA